jgi:5-formyltetrahydrofolate cyclo-ligase
MTKKELRKLYKEKRNSLTDTERSKMDDLLLIQLQQAGLPFIQTLLSYWPIESNNEPNTHPFSRYIDFLNPGLVVGYPVADFGTGKMKAVATDEQTIFVKNEYHIYEPSEANIINPAAIDMIFVPLLAVDQGGYRLGYGKGFYDRYLSGCSSSCLKIGFSYFDPINEIPEKQDFDIPLNLCITPQTVYVF